jgi:hypothetical protein
MEYAKSTGGGGKWVSGKARFEERNGTWKVIFAPKELGDDPKSYKFPDSLLPEFPKKVEIGTKYYVVIVLEAGANGEASTKVEKVSDIRPLTWVDEKMKIVDCTREGNKPEGTPKFYSKKSAYKEDEEVHQINWMFEFQEGDFEGVRVPYNVHYRFTCSDDGLAIYDFSEYVYNLPQASRVHQVVNFYEKLLGVLDKPITWEEDGNIIPTLYGRILEANKTFLVSGSNGWIQDKEIEVVDVPEPSPDPDVEKEDHAVTDTHPEDELPEEW